MENNMPKKPGLFARMFGKSWEEAVQEIEAIKAKLDKEKAELDQREAAIVKRENELARKESELAKRRNELQKRESKVREQEKKYKRKEKTRERITPKEVEHLEIQTNPQVEVYVGPKVEVYKETKVPVQEQVQIPAQVPVAVVSEPVIEIDVEPEIEKEEPVAEEKLEIVEEPKVEEKLEIVEEPKVEEKLEIVEEPIAEEKLEIVEEPKVEEKLEIVEEPKVEEKLEIVEQPKPQKIDDKKSKQKAKNKPAKVAQYSEELNEKRNAAILEAIKELNIRMERQLKLDDVQAATTTMRTPEADNMVKKRRVANVATIKGYLFGLIAAYLDTLPKEDLKYIEIEGLTATEFLRFLASDYEFEFERDEDDTKSSAISKNGNFASNRFIYGAMGGYGRIINDVIENEKYAAEIKALANNWLVGSYLDETLDETAPNMRRGIEIETQKLAKRDERLEKDFGDAGQVL